MNRLGLFGNQLTSINTELWKLTNLQELNLGGNPLRVGISSQITNLTKLSHVLFHETKIPCLPLCLTRIKEMKRATGGRTSRCDSPSFDEFDGKDWKWSAAFEACVTLLLARKRRK